MAWLFIDTRQKDRSQIAWLPAEGDIVKRDVRGRAKAVLSAIGKDWDSEAPKLKGVIVASGPGSFSSIRTGVLYANLFSRFLGLPMYEVVGTDAMNLEEIRDLAKTGAMPNKQYIEPRYDREPNITTPNA